MNLLVVEDSPSMRRALTRRLEGQVEQLTMASTAEQALALLDSLGTFDTILSDFDLGAGMDGEMLALRLADKYSNLEFYGMSGDPRNWDYAFNLGFVNEVWDKGASPLELYRMLGLTEK